MLSFLLLLLLLSSLAVWTKNVGKEEIEQFIASFEHPPGSSSINSLSLVGSGSQDAFFRVIRGDVQQVTLGLVYETSSLVLSNQNQQIFEVNNDQMLVKAKKIRMRSLRITSMFSFQNIPQWRLFTAEYFGSNPVGWSNNTVSQCGGIQMLGGHGRFGGGLTRKIFPALGKHTIIKVQANFHFIDSWRGEIGFLQMDTGQDQQKEYVWSHKYDSADYDRDQGVSVCGRDFPEFKLSQRVDITLDHNAENVQVVFGSTLGSDPFEASWGISDFKIYIK